jgi:NADPH-dependent 2,4-dienoyl-CoA reductase/sulfur reductase-like enzyme
MSDVSVIGAGAMGSALVEVLAASGAEVTGVEPDRKPRPRCCRVRGSASRGRWPRR